MSVAESQRSWFTAGQAPPDRLQPFPPRAVFSDLALLMHGGNRYCNASPAYLLTRLGRRSSIDQKSVMECAFGGLRMVEARIAPIATRTLGRSKFRRGQCGFAVRVTMRDLGSMLRAT